jgi:hypothetical protein
MAQGDYGRVSWALRDSKCESCCFRHAKKGFAMGQSISRSCRRTLRASVLVAATAALAVAVPSAAAAATVTRSEFGATFVNACTGELIEISGTVQERFHATFDPQGGTHTGTTITVSDVKGVGVDTGTTYVATGVFLAQTNIHQHGFVATSVNFPQFSSAVNLISQGSADNLIAHLLFHETLRLDGGPVVIVDEARSECLG